MNKYIRFFVTVVLAVSIAIPSLAQQQEEDEKKTSGTRRQLATIIFAGLGGAVLGLSTLSFYGRPQDKLSNIAIGFAIGVIGGTVYVTYKTATTPRRSAFLDPHFENLAENQRESFIALGHSETPQATFRFEF